MCPSHKSILEKAMAPHSSTLAWKIPWTEEPGGLQSMRSLRVRHDWVILLWLFTFMHWRRKWQPTPVFLPGESQGRESLVGCHLWGHTELDTTEWLSNSNSRKNRDKCGRICVILGSGSGVSSYRELEGEEFRLTLESFLHWEEFGLFSENIFQFPWRPRWTVTQQANGIIMCLNK